MMKEMIQSGCCGSEIPPGIDYEGKSLEQCLNDACLELLASTAEACFYKASLDEDGQYLCIAND